MTEQQFLSYYDDDTEVRILGAHRISIQNAESANHGLVVLDPGMRTTSNGESCACLCARLRANFVLGADFVHLYCGTLSGACSWSQTVPEKNQCMEEIADAIRYKAHCRVTTINTTFAPAAPPPPAPPPATPATTR